MCKSKPALAIPSKEGEHIFSLDGEKIPKNFHGGFPRTGLTHKDFEERFTLPSKATVPPSGTKKPH